MAVVRALHLRLMLAMAGTEAMAGDQAGEDTAEEDQVGEAMEGVDTAEVDTAGEVSLYRVNMLFSPVGVLRLGAVLGVLMLVCP